MSTIIFNGSPFASDVPGRLQQGDSQVSGHYRYLMERSTSLDDSTDEWQNPPITTNLTNRRPRRDSVHAEDGIVVDAIGRRWPAEQGRMLGLSSERPSGDSKSKKRSRANDSTGSLTEQTPRTNWALAPVFTPESGGGTTVGPSSMPFVTPTPPSNFLLHSALADYTHVTECTKALANETGRDDQFQHAVWGPELYSPLHIKRTCQPSQSTRYGNQPPNNRRTVPNCVPELYPKRLTPKQVTQNFFKSQRSLLEVFAHIQTRIERLVLTHVAISVDFNNRDDFIMRNFIQRCIKHIGNEHEAFAILRHRPDLHPALVSGLIWQLAGVLIFQESLMDTFTSQHALPFKLAWSIEMEGRCEYGADEQHEVAHERAEIARQIIKIPGFWSRWRLHHARNLSQQFLNALRPAWSVAQSSPVTGGGSNLEWDTISTEVETVVRMMLEVAVRLRQDTCWYDLDFPRYSDDFDGENMVVARTLLGVQCGALDDAPLSVHLAKSPSLVKSEAQSDGQKASVCTVEYKAEVLFTNLEQVVHQVPAPRRASWSIVEHVVHQGSARRISW